MKIRCPECTASFNVADDHRDRNVLCPCGCKFAAVDATPSPVAKPAAHPALGHQALAKPAAAPDQVRPPVTGDIRIRCPDCGRRFDLAAADRDRRVQCPCGLKFIAGEHVIARQSAAKRLRLNGAESHHRIFFIGEHGKHARSRMLQPPRPLAQTA